MNGRDWRVPPGKIPGLIRIAVLGDSFVYGQGVSPFETLPFFLEQQLNELSTGSLFQVVNCGVSGFNIWNSLSSLRNLPEFYDAVILILCVNDVQVFERTFGVDYTLDTAAMWEPRTPTFEFLQASLGEAKNWLAERDVLFLVGYYSVWEVDYEARATRILDDLCGALGIPFADFFGYFQERRLRASELNATKFDLHPSRIAHGAAARYLAQLFHRHGWTQRFNTPRSPGILPQAVLAIAQEMDREGSHVETVLRWASDALMAKTRAVARLPNEQDRREFAETSKSGLEWFNASYAEWRSSARALALANHLFTRDSGLPTRVWNTDEAILRAEELLMAASLPNKAAVASMISRLPSNWAAPRQVDFSPSRAALAAGLQKIACLRHMMEKASKGDDATTLPSLEAGSRDTQSSLGDLAELATILSRHVSVLDRRISEAEAAVTEMSDEAAYLISQAKQCLVEAAEHLSASCSQYDYLLEDAPREPQFLTTLDVYVKTLNRPGEMPFMLDVIVDSIAPHRMVMKDGMYVGPDGMLTLVRLRFPIFFFGRATIATHPPRPESPGKRGSLVKMEIYNDPASRLTLNPTELYRTPTGDLVFPFVLVP